MIYPNGIKAGSIIKIVSPSNGLNCGKVKELENALLILKKYNYKIIEDQYTRCSRNGMSANCILRAKELNDSFSDSSNALIAVSGGDFLNQIMDKLNFKKYIRNVKWIQGHSDITNLLYYLTVNYDIATIYNYNASKYSIDNKKMIEYGVSALENKLDIEESFTTWQSLNGYHAVKGRIIGGCLESLKDIFGTKYDSFKKFQKKYKDDGIIWYFDISSSSNEDISRTMWQLKIMGHFKYCKAILFGKLIEEKNFTGLDFKTAITSELSDLNIPILINCDIGHTKPVITIINGSITKISKKNNKFIMEIIKK